MGFIRNLPPDLISAFRATLEEIEMSVLIINVVDASNSQFREQVEAVNSILEGLHLDNIRQLTVFNKLDRLDPHEAKGFSDRKDAVAVSALTGEGSETLVERIGEIIREHMIPKAFEMGSDPKRSKSVENSPTDS